MGENNILPQELLNVIAEIAAKAGVEAYKDEAYRDEKRKKSEKLKKTKEVIRSYRRNKAKLREEWKFTEEEQAEYRWNYMKDLMETNGIYVRSERIISDEERIRQESLYLIHRVESAMKMYKEECELSHNEEDMRRYRIIHAMYIAEEQLSAQEVAERENVSDKTVYRDLGIAFSILSIYLN